MRHRKAGRKLNINSSHRKAMFRNMVTSLFKYDRIRTTDAKAKELRRLADHLVTLAKRGDLHARRQALSIVREPDVVHKLFENANERFGSVSGGYTRIIKIGRRPGDAALMSFVELVTPATGKKKTAKKKVAKKTAPATAKEKEAPGKPEAAAVQDEEGSGEASPDAKSAAADKEEESAAVEEELPSAQTEAAEPEENVKGEPEK
jgi:large subunit ribosomal protein L17